MRKSWGDVFNARLARGDDHGYAAYSADQWEKRQMRKVIEPVWLLTEGDHIVVLVEVAGKWREIIRERKGGEISHIFEGELEPL